MIYRVLGRTNVLDDLGKTLNDSARLIKKYAGRKGGRRRVKKGFAKTLTSEKAREYARKRWRGKDSSSGASTEQEKLEN